VSHARVPPVEGAHAARALARALRRCPARESVRDFRTGERVMKGLRSILALSIALFALGACNKHDEPPAAEASSGGDNGDNTNSDDTNGNNTFLNGDKSTGQKINGSEDTSDKAGMY
jgi:hypothetical protein